MWQRLFELVGPASGSPVWRMVMTGFMAAGRDLCSLLAVRDHLFFYVCWASLWQLLAIWLDGPPQLA